MKSTTTVRLRMLLAGVGLAAMSFGTGCQITENGQTLPSAWYYYDDIQYFPAGPEFKLANEAAAQKAYKADLQAQALQPAQP